MANKKEIKLYTLTGLYSFEIKKDMIDWFLDKWYRKDSITFTDKNNKMTGVNLALYNNFEIEEVDD